MTTLPQTSTSIQLPRPVGSAGMIGAAHAAPQMHAGPSNQMTGSDIWRVIRTNIWLILGSLILSVIAGFVLNMYLSRFHSRYTATGYVQVQAGRQYAMIAKDNTFTGPQDSLVVDQRTQASLLTTDALFIKVFQNKQDIRNTEWFAQFKNPDGTADTASAIEDLNKHFSASPYPDSKLIAVSMTWKIPADCRVIVNDIVEQHLEEQHKVSNDSLTKQSLALSNQITKYQTQINTLKKQQNELAITLNLDGQSPRGMGAKEQELALYITQKLKAEGELNEARSAKEGAEATIARGETPGAVEMMVEQTFMVQQLKMQLMNFDLQIAANIRDGDKARVVETLKATKEAAENLLQEHRDRERLSATSAYLAQLSGQYQGAMTSVQEINKQIGSIMESMATMTGKVADYMTKKDEQAGYEELLRQTKDQQDTLQTMLTQLDMNSVAWANKPVDPLFPSFPKLPYTLSVCMMLGLGLSIGISFLREILDTSVRSPRDIARVGQMTLLGMIPDEADDPQAAGIPLPTVIYAAPTSMLAEQYRQVRTRLQHAASLDTTRSILVTSPSPGDGKSTVACNLASGLALNGRRILLVDANFRRPELHKIFAVGNEAGLGNVLSSIENFESAIRQTRVPNLDVMTTGPKPANATELLESQLLIDFIERALEEYDHVIFDSGPLLFVSETVALAPRVDGVVTVVRAKANSRGLLQRMRDQLRQLKAEHLGVVLNGVRSTGGGYYGRNIKTYYEYQNGATAA